MRKTITFTKCIKLICAALIFNCSLIVPKAYAQISANPFSTIQALREQPTAAARQSVTDWVSSIFTAPGQTYNPLIFANSLDSVSDDSIKYLGQIFGNVPSVLVNTGTPTTLLSSFFYIFNNGVLSALGLLISYNVIVGIASTASQGEFLGRRQQSPQLQVFRSVIGTMFLVPQYNGYNFMQVFIMWVVTQGVYLANAVWFETINVVNQTNSIMPFIKLTPAQETSTNNTINPDVVKNNLRPDIITLSENILQSQACLDYGVVALQDAYDLCIATYKGTTSENNCVPPDRTSYILIDDNAYTITFNTSGLPLQAAEDSLATTKPACGKYTMSFEDSMSESYKSTQWSAFKTLVDDLGPESSDSYTELYQDYFMCDEDETCTPPCYEGTSETADHIAAEIAGGDDTCNIFNEITQPAINEYVDAVAKIQVDSATGSVEAVSKGPSFIPGGWITAATSYYALVSSVANVSQAAGTSGSVQAENLNAGTVTTLKSLFDYVVPSSAGSNASSGTSESSDPDATLDNILQKWQDSESRNVQADTVQEASNSSSSIGWAIFACLSGAKTVNGESCQDYAPDASYISFDDFNVASPELEVSDSNGNSSEASSLLYLPMGYIAQGYAISKGVVDNPWSKMASGLYSINGGDVTYDVTYTAPPRSPDSISSHYDNMTEITNDYVSNLHSAMIYGFFGGSTIRSVIDPIYRMQSTGLRLIHFGINYTGRMVKLATDFATGFITDLVNATLALSFAEIGITLIINGLSLIWQAGWYLAFIFAPPIFAIPFVGWVLGPIVLAIGMLIMAVVYGVQIALVVAKFILFVFPGVFMIIIQKILLTAFAYFQVQMYMVIPILILGGYIGIYVSMVPYLVFLCTVCGWFLLVLEVMAAGPIISLGLVYAEGSEMMGRSEQLITMLIVVFVRPVTIVIGFLMGIILAGISLYALNLMFFPVVLEGIGYLTSNSYFSNTIGNAFIPVANNSVPNINLSTSDLLVSAALLLFYAYIAGTLIYQCFSATFMIPLQVVRWLDPRGAESPQEIQGAISENKQQFVSELVSGLANSIAQLGGLSQQLFGMLSYVGMQGSFQQATSSTGPALASQNQDFGAGTVQARQRYAKSRKNWNNRMKSLFGG